MKIIARTAEYGNLDSWQFEHKTIKAITEKAKDLERGVTAEIVEAILLSIEQLDLTLAGKPANMHDAIFRIAKSKGLSGESCKQIAKIALYSRS